MSNRRRVNLVFVGVFVVPAFVVFVFVGVGVGVGVVVVSAGVFGVVVGVRGRRRDSRVPAGLRPVPPLAARSLRWVRGLLPGDEGAAWLAEVTSCLAETPDPRANDAGTCAATAATRRS